MRNLNKFFVRGYYQKRFSNLYSMGQNARSCSAKVTFTCFIQQKQQEKYQIRNRNYIVLQKIVDTDQTSCAKKLTKLRPI